MLHRIHRTTLIHYCTFSTAIEWNLFVLPWANSYDGNEFAMIKKQNFPLPDDMADQRSIKKTMLMDEIRIIAGRKCDQQWAEFCGIRYKSTEIMYINFHLLLMEPKEKKKPSTIWWTFLISLPSCAICLCSKQCALPKIRGLMFVCISWNEGGVWPMEKKKINKT